MVCILKEGYFFTSYLKKAIQPFLVLGLMMSYYWKRKFDTRKWNSHYVTKIANKKKSGKIH